eukprot:11811564-Prorocentrum_lima.AAC.1
MCIRDSLLEQRTDLATLPTRVDRAPAPWLHLHCVASGGPPRAAQFCASPRESDAGKGAIALSDSSRLLSSAFVWDSEFKP